MALPNFLAQLTNMMVCVCWSFIGRLMKEGENVMSAMRAEESDENSKVKAKQPD